MAYAQNTASTGLGIGALGGGYYIQGYSNVQVYRQHAQSTQIVYHKLPPIQAPTLPSLTCLQKLRQEITEWHGNWRA